MDHGADSYIASRLRTQINLILLGVIVLAGPPAYVNQISLGNDFLAALVAIAAIYAFFLAIFVATQIARGRM